MTWNVYLNGHLIDSVWYTKGLDSEYVRTSLINRDGFDPSIIVKLSK